MYVRQQWWLIQHRQPQQPTPMKDESNPLLTFMMWVFFLAFCLAGIESCNKSKAETPASANR